MVISHNIAAMNAQRQFGINANNKIKTSEKLASGYKINRAADDAAGLAISEKMRKQIRGLTQGVENTQAGISLCQVADGALAEVHDMLQRINELAVQSANGTNSYSDRQAIQEEVNQLLIEIERVGETTTFNDNKIFVGKLYNREINVKPNVLQNTYSETKQGFIRDYTVAMVDGSDFSLSANTENSILLTSSNISAYTTEIYPDIFVLQEGTYQIDDSIHDVALKLSGDVIIHDSDLNNVSLVGEGCNLTIKNVSMKTDAYTSYTWQGIYFENSDNTLTFLGENNLEVDWGATAAINICDANLEINGNGTLNVYAIGSDASGIAAESQSSNHGNITINSGNINIVTEGNPGNGEYQVGIGNYDRNLHSINELTINGGKINVQSLSYGSAGIAVRKLTMAGGSLLASAADYNRNAFAGVAADIEKNGMGIIVDDLIQTGGSMLAIGGNGLDAQGSAILEYNATTDVGRKTLTTDGYYYYLNVFDDYFHNYDKQETYMGENTLWIQSGCDVGDGISLEIDGMSTEILGIKDIDVSTEAGADSAMEAIDKAIIRLSASRSKIGAQQNRLEHTVDNENNIIENTTAAESRIRDTDMAELMVKHSKESILEQVGQSMMAQANQSTQGVLSLLQ